MRVSAYWETGWVGLEGFTGIQVSSKKFSGVSCAFYSDPSRFKTFHGTSMRSSG